MFFRNIFEIWGGGQGGGIHKFYMKFWWPLFLAMKFTFLFLNLAKIHIIIYYVLRGEGGSVLVNFM